MYSVKQDASPHLIGNAAELVKQLGGVAGRAPCPLCQKGKRDTALSIWQDKAAVRFHCYRCSDSKTLFALLKEHCVDNRDFSGTDSLDGQSGMPHCQRLPTPASNDQTRRNDGNKRWARMIWNESQPLRLSDPACLYLASRGLPVEKLLPVIGNNLRYHTRLKHWPTKQTTPALIGRIQRWSEAASTGVHRIYLCADSIDAFEERAAIMLHDACMSRAEAEHAALADSPVTKIKQSPKMMLGSVRGAACWLGPPIEAGRPIAVCEGIETGLAVLATYPDFTVAAALSTAGAACLALPEPHARGPLFGFPDGDEASAKAFHALHEKTPLAGVMPLPTGLDYLDFTTAQHSGNNNAPMQE